MRRAAIENERDRGYRRMDFDTFLLDGRDLAANSSKVAIEGNYLKSGEAEYILPSESAIVSMV